MSEYTQSVGRGSARLKAGIYTRNNTDIHALSGIRTDDPSVRVREDSSCLRLRGHSDRQEYRFTFGLFSDAFSSSECTASNGSVINEYLI
jgi:hypothetical protein